MIIITALNAGNSQKKCIFDFIIMIMNKLKEKQLLKIIRNSYNKTFTVNFYASEL